MKFIVVIVMILIVIVPSIYAKYLTLACSFIWLIYTVYYTIKLYKIKDKKIITAKYLEYSPNNNKASYIRYLYKGKIDYKVFILTILELISKNSIKIEKCNGNYYLIDEFYEKAIENNLTKSEISMKKMLFNNIGVFGKLSLKELYNTSKKNSGYFNTLYKEWENTFYCEVAKNKYFKSIKPVIENSLLYFMISMMLVIYNLFFTGYISISSLIFIVTSLLIISVNNYKNKESDAKDEYKKWLEFKNYIKKEDNSLSEMDNATLECYSMYAYALDETENYVNILNKKSKCNSLIFNDNIILDIINNREFINIESKIKKCIKTYKFKVLIKAKNKGRI